MKTADLTPWKELTGLLCPESPDLFNDVKLAVESKDKYFKKYKEELYERGIEDQTEVDPWIALIDGLIYKKKLFECDIKIDPEYLVEDLKSLQICKKAKIDFSILNDTECYGEELLFIAGNILAGHSLSLVCLDIESDSYPLIVVPNNNLPTLKKLVKQIKQNLVMYSEKQKSNLSLVDFANNFESKVESLFFIESPESYLIFDPKEVEKDSSGKVESVLWQTLIDVSDDSNEEDTNLLLLIQLSQQEFPLCTVAWELFPEVNIKKSINRERTALLELLNDANAELVGKFRLDERDPNEPYLSCEITFPAASCDKEQLNWAINELLDTVLSQITLLEDLLITNEN